MTKPRSGSLPGKRRAIHYPDVGARQSQPYNRPPLTFSIDVEKSRLRGFRAAKTIDKTTLDVAGSRAKVPSSLTNSLSCCEHHTKALLHIIPNRWSMLELALQTAPYVRIISGSFFRKVHGPPHTVRAKAFRQESRHVHCKLQSRPWDYGTGTKRKHC